MKHTFTALLVTTIFSTTAIFASDSVLNNERSVSEIMETEKQPLAIQKIMKGGQGLLVNAYYVAVNDLERAVARNEDLTKVTERLIAVVQDPRGNENVCPLSLARCYFSEEKYRMAEELLRIFKRSGGLVGDVDSVLDAVQILDDQIRFQTTV